MSDPDVSTDQTPPMKHKPATPERNDSFRVMAEFQSKVVSRRPFDSDSSDEDDYTEEVDMGKRMNSRSLVVVKNELLTSEEDYVYCLGLIVDGYLSELDTNPHKPDFLVERKASIFGNIAQVYELHKKILEVVRNLKSTETLCNGFLQRESEFMEYLEYLKTISSGWKALATFGGSFFDDVKRERRLGYPLLECYNRSFVRLKQYCELFKELLAGTQKEELHSVGLAQQTYSMLSKVWKTCSNAVAVGNLRGSPAGVLTEEGLLMVNEFLVTTIQKKKKKKDQLTAFLHPNCVLLAKKEVRDDIHPPAYIYHDHLPLSTLSLSEEYKTKSKFALSSDKSIATADLVYVLQPVEEEELSIVKATWTSKIQELLMVQFEAIRDRKGGAHQDLPPPIVHHIELPKDKSPRTSSHTSGRNVSKIASTVSDVSSKTQSRVVTSPKIVQDDVPLSQQVELYEVHCAYSPESRESLHLAVGQLVEVLDRSGGDSWLVCTYSTDRQHEATEGFVPSKCLKPYKSGNRESMLSLYSVKSEQQGGGGGSSRQSIASRSGQSSRPSSTASHQPPPTFPTSRPGSHVGPAPPPVVDPAHHPSLPNVSLPLRSPSLAAEDILWYAMEDFAGEGGFRLRAGEAVQVFDTSGASWLVCTVQDPEEGYVPSSVLSQAPSTPHVPTQASVIEAATPTYPEANPPLPPFPATTPPSVQGGGTASQSVDPINSQNSFESVTTPTSEPERASLGGRVSGVLREALEEITGTGPQHQHQQQQQQQQTSPSLPTQLPVPRSQSGESAGSRFRASFEDSFEDVAVTPGEPAADDEGGLSGPQLTSISEQGEPPKKLLYCALADYERRDDTGLSLQEGRLYQALDTSDDVWWLVAPAGSGSDQPQGWTPANHLERVQQAPPPESGSTAPAQSNAPDEEPPPSDHESEEGTPEPRDPETPGILVTSDPMESSLTRSQIEEHKPKPPKYYVSKAHVMAAEKKELSLFLGQKVEVLDDSEENWWLVKTLERISGKTQGWVPCKALEPFVALTLEKSIELKAQDSVHERKYMTTVSDFGGDPSSHQLSVAKDEAVEVIDDSNPDWIWVCTVHRDSPQEGYLPRDLLY